MESIRNALIRIMFLVSIFCFSFSSAQIERWIYIYNGVGDDTDEAYSIVYGGDGNIYVAGDSKGNGSGTDFTVISLDPSGNERWVYTYNGPGNSDDHAKQLVYGSDGHIYACGSSIGTSGGADFAILSLTQSGVERWVYRYNGTGNANDEALSITFGPDNNIYAAGYCYGISSYRDFMVVSLDTAGDERWIYVYDAGLHPGHDFASAIVCGDDNNIYAAGQIYNWVTLEDFAMVSLDSAGSVRWVGLFDGNTITPPDYANTIAYGLDGEPFAAGLIGSWVNGRPEFTVLNRENAGNYDWSYTYQGSANLRDEAYSITYGADNNVYVAGYTTWNTVARDFTVLSLTNDGDLNWIYLYNGSGNDNDEVYSVIYGLDGYIYAAGFSNVVGFDDDFTVIRLDTAGNEKWVYEYNGAANGSDKAFSIAYGSDNCIYVAGRSYDSITHSDFTVISLDTTTSWIEEEKVAVRKSDFRATIISGPLVLPEGKNCKVFDITGRTIAPDKIKPGIYFIEVDGEMRQKVVKIR